MITLDQWQSDFIAHKGHKILVAGRQTGKSEAQAYDNVEFAVNNDGVNCLLISKTQRQSEELLIKCLNYILEKYPNRIGSGVFKPLKHSVWIIPKDKKKQHSRIMCQPVGLAGEGIRSYTIHKLSADEAQLISDDVFASVTPMLLTTGGYISLSGTPKGRSGFFWEAFQNKLGHFKVFHVNSKQVIEKRPISDTWTEWRREGALKHLAQERQRMTSKQFAQEYEAEFVEDLDSLFPDSLIASACVIFRDKISSKKLFLGVDVGRVHDPSTFEIIDAQNPEMLIHVENIVDKGQTIPQTAEKVKALHKIYNFRKMGIDGGGLGSGVVDLLMEDKTIQERVRDMNNASRVIAIKSSDDPTKKASEQKKRMLKEQMYYNLFSLMVQGKIKLLADEDVKCSLRSVQIEYAEDSDDVKIFGSDTHIVEGIIRAAMLAVKEKTLNLWAA